VKENKTKNINYVLHQFDDLIRKTIYKDLKQELSQMFKSNYKIFFDTQYLDLFFIHLRKLDAPCYFKLKIELCTYERTFNEDVPTGITEDNEHLEIKLSSYIAVYSLYDIGDSIYHEPFYKSLKLYFPYTEDRFLDKVKELNIVGFITKSYKSILNFYS
jgi:hypothetical protein